MYVSEQAMLLQEKWLAEQEVSEDATIVCCSSFRYFCVLTVFEAVSLGGCPIWCILLGPIFIALFAYFCTQSIKVSFVYW